MNLLYRSLIISAAALLSVTASADPLEEIQCELCRGTNNPTDFGNFAFNLVYGPESSHFFSEVIITNPEGGWVYVDLSFELEENIITELLSFIGLDLGIPTGKIIVDTTSDATENFSYEVDLDMVDTIGMLAVPAISGSEGPGPNTGSGGDSSGGDDSGGADIGTGGGGGGIGGGLACTTAGDGVWVCVPR